MLDPVGERTLTDLLNEQADQYGEKPFLVFEDRAGVVSELTYGAFREQAERCAAGFARRGVGHGDFVVVHLRNCPELLVAWFGLARLGAVLVPSNVSNTAPELAHLIAVSGARLAITEPELIAPVLQAAEGADHEVEVLIARR
jgi:crotonobetaine/carnitine-CoA ligase